ncbi:MAG: hypothetical protein ABJB61_11355 [bacterium]
MGPFTGVPAINLAISMGETHLSFDPLIQPPTSTFKLQDERTLVKERFGIDTYEAEEAEHQSIVDEAGDNLVDPNLEATLPEKTATVPANDQPIRESHDFKEAFYASVGTNQFLAQRVALPSMTQPQTSNNILVADSVPYRVRLKQSLTNHVGWKFARRASVILLLLILAAIVTASYWKGKRILPREAVRAPIAEPSFAPTPSNNAGGSRPSTQTVREEPSPFTPNSERRIKVEETTPAEARGRNIKAITKAAPKVTPPESKPASKPSSRTVAVVLQIEQGHVTEAYIQNPQVGLGAYEATALRIARERRYPKDAKLRETVILRVTPER